MTKKEKQLLHFLEMHLTEICFAAVIILSLLIRVSNRHFVSKDASKFLLPWFEEIKAAGGLSALKTQVGDYNALYQFLIALMTYLPFSALTMYKGLSIVFDYVLAAGAGMLALRAAGYAGRPELFTKEGRETDAGKKSRLFMLTFSVVILMPTVIFNSSMWSQCDSIYVSMILWSLVCLADNRDRSAFVLLGLAFSCKLQTVFILPFYLTYYFYQRRFSVLKFLWIPGMMIVTALPAVFAGRSVFDTFSVYMSQTATYEVMTARFPNIWMLFGGSYGSLKNGAILATVAALGMLVYLIRDRRDRLFTAEGMIEIAALMIWTALLILPGMHDRYAYMLDLLLVVLAVCSRRKYGFIALAAVAESTMSYCGYLFDVGYSMQRAALYWLIAYAFFFRRVIICENFEKKQ